MKDNSNLKTLSRTAWRTATVFCQHQRHK